MDDLVYRLERVTKSYASRAAPVLALNECLVVQRGEILVVVGPNGAGKSTLLRLLALIEPPSTGTLEFLGVRLERGARPATDLRRRVVLVFQRPLLLDASVAANVAYGLKIRGERNIGNRVEQALALAGLQHLKGENARSVSGGEAQRVALARALIIEPDVLLLDEPTSNLDPYNVGLIEEIIRAAPVRKRMTVVMVTHNLFQARRLATRVGLLLNGSFVEIASTADFFDQPRDSRTRTFVRGEMVY